MFLTFLSTLTVNFKPIFIIHKKIKVTYLKCHIKVVVSILEKILTVCFKPQHLQKH